MSDPYEGVMQLVTKAQAEQKANTQIFQSKTKDAMQQQEDATNKQLEATGKAALLQAEDTKQIAAGIRDVTGQLNANPTDPTSLMARNNAAIEHFNEQLLANFNAIEQVQGDHSILGSLQQIISLPSLERGVNQITIMKGQAVDANTQLQQQVNNQALQITNAVKTNDTERAVAEQTAAAAEAMAKIAKEKLTTATDLFRAQAMASSEVVSTTFAIAKAKEEALMQPLRMSILKDQLAVFEDNKAIDTMLRTTFGIDGVRFAAFNAMLKNDPATYNAAVHFAISKKFSNPQDAGLIRQLMNENNLTYKEDMQLSDGTVVKAGSAMPALALIQEATRPMISNRVNGLIADYVTAEKAKQVPDAQIAKVLNNSQLLKVELDKLLATQYGKNALIQSDAVNRNPDFIYRQVPGLAAQTPLIQEIVNNSNDKRTDITADNLMQLVKKSNMNVPDDKIADQLVILFQNAFEWDRTNNPVYDSLGIPKPNSAIIKVNRMSWLNRLTTAGDVNRIASKLPLDIGAGGAMSDVNILNKAEVIDRLREIGLRANMNTPLRK